MFEALFVLVFFGLLYVDIIECLEKCDRPHALPLRGVHRESKDTSDSQ